MIATPAHTRKAAAAKRRVWELETFEDADVIGLIAELDAVRIAAAR